MSEAESVHPVGSSGSESTGWPFVKSQRIRFDEPLALECGRELPAVEVVYETYGQLDADRANAVLICHALSGDAHVAGYHPGQNPDDPRTKPGWWDHYVGPGRPIDTDRYFVICSNVLGGCKGTTGPGAIDPSTGQPYGLDFPMITIADMVEVQRKLVDQLGIEQLLCVLGGSMGGMQALEWAVRYPQRVWGVIPLATTASLGAQSLAFDAVGRNAILSDPEFHDGRYLSDGTNPSRGLAIARMLGHITYLSEEGMHRKFGRELRHADRKSYDLRSEFSVETYLDYKGESFVDRFDANSYLYITRAMDYFDLGENRGGIEQALAQVAARCLVISFSSDWLFPPKQSRRLVSGLARSGRTVSYIELNSHYGHDSFLLPNPSLERVLPGFLARLYHERVNDAPLPPEEQIISSSSDEKRRLDLEMISRLIRPGESIMDLGCGDGLFLHHMKVRGCDRVQGVDNDEERVVAAIERGVDVILADLNQPLDCFDDNSFDTVVLSRTMQVLYDPSVAMSELLRIGQRAIVSFPNFGYWRNRHQLAWTGRVPVSRNLPFSWIETPNLHHLSLKDFESWCDREGIDIDRRIAMDYEMVEQIRFMPNLRATDAIYIIRRDHNGAGGQGDLPNRASGG